MLKFVASGRGKTEEPSFHVEGEDSQGLSPVDAAALLFWRAGGGAEWESDSTAAVAWLRA